MIVASVQDTSKARGFSLPHATNNRIYSDCRQSAESFANVSVGNRVHVSWTDMQKARHFAVLCLGGMAW